MNTNQEMENKVLQIPVEEIIPNRAQPRLIFDDQSLDELAASIKEHGIIQPLVLRKYGEKYEIIAGERRYRAAKKAGLSKVPAIISNVSDSQSAEMAVIENIQRKDLTAIEEAKSFQSILEKGDISQEELARKMGVSQSAISNKLRLLTLADEVQDAVLEGKISERHARSLLKLNNKEQQKELLEKIINERLTVRQLDGVIKDLIGNIPLVNNNLDLNEVKKNTQDIEPQTIIEYEEPKNDKPKRFFNYLEEAEVNMDTNKIDDNSEKINIFDFNPEKNTESLNINDESNSKSSFFTIPEEEKEEVVESLDFNTPVEEIESLDEFEEPVEDDIVSKIKAALAGVKYQINETKENNKRIITIQIDD